MQEIQEQLLLNVLRETALLVIINLNKDSGKFSSYDEEWKAKAISRDHKPELPDERERIEANNGRVERYTSNS